MFSHHTIGGSCVPRLHRHGQTGTAKQLEALCSCTKLLEVLCSADVFFNTWRPCVPDYKLLEVLCSATDRHTPFSRERSIRF